MAKGEMIELENTSKTNLHKLYNINFIHSIRNEYFLSEIINDTVTK